MSALPPGLESKAIYLPSGDQHGVPVSGPLNEVNWIGFEPSLAQTQISKLPDRSDAKTMLLPSGAYRALVSRRVEAVNLDGSLLWPGEAGASTRRLFKS